MTSLPLLAAALQVGDITAEHAHAAVTAITAIDDACPGLDPSARNAAEQILLDVALAGPPSKVAARGQELLLALSTPEVDGCAAEDVTRNQLTVTRSRTGRHIVRGDFDIETAEKLHTALSGLSAPCPAVDGTPDDRSPARTGSGICSMPTSAPGPARPKAASNHTSPSPPPFANSPPVGTATAAHAPPPPPSRSRPGQRWTGRVG